MKKIIGLIIVFFIILIFSFIAIRITSDNNYEIENVTNFSYFKLYEDEKYGVIDASGNVIVPAKYDLLEIPNPSKAVFIGYIKHNEEEFETEVLNDSNEKILEKYSRN